MSERLVFERQTGPITWVQDFVEFGEVRRESEMVARFVIRYRTTDSAGNAIQISAKTHRILWDGAIWRITSAPHDHKRMNLIIDADASTLVDATDMDSETTEFVDDVPDIRPLEES
jgi:hypothetical protein